MDGLIRLRRRLLYESNVPERIRSREEAVRERAYRLWEADGCREGSADYDWYLAIELLDEEATF
ncbi:DUF2934 domain-containing protein [Caballeronia grimmiae]|uniref:DUF2934 domain-containing protein n=1 Tax=Caballeronia grimmiae TaxID=1071679 RepID=UPI00094E9F66|nr:DUF2934 domain-containing protein [Caballeronia grimmiae]